ncbi:PfkB family carbohydrate kinase [Nibricoccus sp. IMCC34717]|uniref:PfkB family carbohydrate kinase n=1 Tax=Nibricoccus sp. IMCC34717 TaxID=3034021 RepID=UPI00384F032E
MSFQQRALQELRSLRGNIQGKHCVAGFDGFVDTIVTPVATRHGEGEQFKPIDTMTEFAQRIAAAAGKSTNIEYFPRMDKLGGNGPIMCNALLAAGTSLTYIGALGRDHVHPVFGDMAAKSKAVYTVAAPGHTTAVEFLDGKLMFGLLRSLDEVTFPAIEAAMGRKCMEQEFGSADLIALVNWTMLPYMTSIFNELRTNLFPRLPRKPRRFFFDLADPEKRLVEDLQTALKEISKFQEHGDVTLGLNFKESQQVHSALGLGPVEGEDEATLKAVATRIREKLAVSCVVVHPRKSAACATESGTAWVPGPYCENPLITTGAGDHFNAGFSVGQLLGASPETALALGVCTSGHYVRTAKSPTLADLEAFLSQWS